MVHKFSNTPDLLIEIKSESSSAERVFVSSQALKNASPVLKCMIDPKSGFQPLPIGSTSEGDLPILALPDDDAPSMLLLCRILHYKTRDVPKTLEYDSLFQIAFLCDKYDCSDIVYPWVESWIGNLITNDDFSKQTAPGREGWLLIGRVFKDIDGVPDFIRKFSLKLVKEFFIWDSPQQYRFLRIESIQWNPCFVSSIPLPDAILGHIWKEREAMIERLKLVLTQFYKDMQLTEIASSKRLCNDELCLDIARGSLVRSLQECGLPPTIQEEFPVTYLRKKTLNMLFYKLKSIECKTLVPWSIVEPRRMDLINQDPATKVSSSSGLNLLKCAYLRNPTSAGKWHFPSVKLFIHMVIFTNKWLKDPRPPNALKGGDWSQIGRCGIAARMLKFREEVDLSPSLISGYHL